MKHLRQYIRKIILEDRQKQDDYRDWLKPHLKSSEGKEYEYWFEDDDYTKHMDMLKRTKPSKLVDDAVKARREIKKYWNANADLNFIQNNFDCLHQLDYYGKGTASSLQKSVSSEFNMRDLSPIAFAKEYPPGERQKDEMSTWGIYRKYSNIAEFMGWRRMNFAVRLNGRITFAAAHDSHTESRSKALPSDYQRYKSSGMPKRPRIDGEQRGLIFDAADAEIFQTGNAGEFIVDNWTWDTLYIRESGVHEDMIEMILEEAEQQNFKVIIV